MRLRSALLANGLSCSRAVERQRHDEPVRQLEHDDLSGRAENDALLASHDAAYPVPVHRNVTDRQLHPHSVLTPGVDARRRLAAQAARDHHVAPSVAYNGRSRRVSEACAFLISSWEGARRQPQTRGRAAPT